MVEATHDADVQLSGDAPIGKGLRVYAGKVTIDDGQTIDTGMSEVISAVLTPSSTAFTSNVTSTSGGVITADVKEADGTTGASGETVHVIAVGYVN